MKSINPRRTLAPTPVGRHGPPAALSFILRSVLSGAGVGVCVWRAWTPRVQSRDVGERGGRGWPGKAEARGPRRALGDQLQRRDPGGRTLSAPSPAPPPSSLLKDALQAELSATGGRSYLAEPADACARDTQGRGPRGRVSREPRAGTSHPPSFGLRSAPAKSERCPPRARWPREEPRGKWPRVRRAPRREQPERHEPRAGRQRRPPQPLPSAPPAGPRALASARNAEPRPAGAPAQPPAPPRPPLTHSGVAAAPDVASRAAPRGRRTRGAPGAPASPFALPPRPPPGRPGRALRWGRCWPSACSWAGCAGGPRAPSSPESTATAGWTRRAATTRASSALRTSTRWTPPSAAAPARCATAAPRPTPGWSRAAAPTTAGSWSTRASRRVSAGPRRLLRGRGRQGAGGRAGGRAHPEAPRCSWVCARWTQRGRWRDPDGAGGSGQGGPIPLRPRLPLLVVRGKGCRDREDGEAGPGDSGEAVWGSRACGRLQRRAVGAATRLAWVSGGDEGTPLRAPSLRKVPRAQSMQLLGRAHLQPRSAEERQPRRPPPPFVVFW